MLDAVARLSAPLKAALLAVTLGSPLVGIGCNSAGTGPDPAGSEAESLYFPPTDGAWESVDPAAIGWRVEELEAALEYAGDQRSSGVVVLYQGRIVAERYWEVSEIEGSVYSAFVTGLTEDGRALEDVASVQKSVVSFLAGVGRGKALVDLEAPVSWYLGAGWSQANSQDEAAIRVRHLMSMSSGLTRDHTFEVPSGEKWMYNTNVYSQTVKVLEVASGLEVNEYTSRWLTSRIGMSDSRWVPRSWARPDLDANTIGFQTTALDLARFGILMLAKGRWRGEDILGDADYLAESLSPSQEMNPAYGLLWWLNSGPNLLTLDGGEREATILIPSAPDDLYEARGFLARRLYVVPSLNLVVTRLGDAPAPDFDDVFWSHLMGAIGA